MLTIYEGLLISLAGLSLSRTCLRLTVVYSKSGAVISSASVVGDAVESIQSS